MGLAVEAFLVNKLYYRGLATVHFFDRVDYFVNSFYMICVLAVCKVWDTQILSCVGILTPATQSN